MKKLNKRLLFSFLAASFLMCNNAFAVEEINMNDSDNLSYSYMNNQVLGSEQSDYDVDAVNKLSLSSTGTAKDISAYISMSVRERQMEKMQNKMAALDNDYVFEPINNTMPNLNVWVRPYASIEHVRTGQGKFEVQTWGNYVGANSGIIELSNGWDAIIGGYLGYNGGHITRPDLSAYENGGTLGLETMFMKNHFFTGFDISTGAMATKFNYANKHWITGTYLTTGISNKTGYNWELADGKFIIQPYLVLGYTFAHQFGRTKYESTVEAGSLNSGLIEPGLNIIGKFESGWQPYAGVSFVQNLVNNDDLSYQYAVMPDMAARGFIKYGLGVRKNWKDRVGVNFQTFARNCGRYGVGFQGGLDVALGK
ncbi:autotransporter outer membrane beta-barrel domain-containing protein [bacterium]|nr:autotransporter outer membrane beta-barrel domain-containing protein [bacterium]